MTWGKIDTGFHRNPKIRMAGPDAREVFLYIVLANAEQYGDGVLTAHYANPAFLADALQRSEETVRNALERCETFHLLHVTATEISIVGWDDTWRTKKSTNRVRKHREKKKNQRVIIDETLRNGSNVTGNGRNALDREIDRTEIDRENRERSKVKTLNIPDRAFRAADYLRERVLRDQASNALGRKAWERDSPTRINWASTFDVLHRLDLKPWDDIALTVAWLFDSENTFVVQSPGGLRKKWDRIKKQMNRPIGNSTANPPPGAGQRIYDMSEEMRLEEERRADEEQ